MAKKEPLFEDRLRYLEKEVRFMWVLVILGLINIVIFFFKALLS